MMKNYSFPYSISYAIYLDNDFIKKNTVLMFHSILS